LDVKITTDYFWNSLDTNKDYEVKWVKKMKNDNQVKRENHDRPWKIDKERSQDYTRFIKARKTNNQAITKNIQ
jgi:hypothetical protein